MEKNAEAELGIEQEENSEENLKNEEQEQEQNIEQEDNVLDDAELEKMYKDTFNANGKLAIEGGFTDISDCIRYILRELKNLFISEEKTYEHLGLSGKHDSDEPLSPEAKKTAEKLMKYMTTREVLYKEQEQRQAKEQKEPSLIEIMSAEMEPEEFMTLVTSTPSFQSALRDMTCTGIYNFVADEYSADLKKLAGKVRAEMPQTARQYLKDLGGEPPKKEANEPVNNTQKENEVKVCQGPR